MWNHSHFICRMKISDVKMFQFHMFSHVKWHVNLLQRLESFTNSVYHHVPTLCYLQVLSKQWLQTTWDSNCLGELTRVLFTDVLSQKRKFVPPSLDVDHNHQFLFCFFLIFYFYSAWSDTPNFESCFWHDLNLVNYITMEIMRMILMEVPLAWMPHETLVRCSDAVFYRLLRVFQFEAKLSRARNKYT